MLSTREGYDVILAPVDGCEVGFLHDILKEAAYLGLP